MWEQIKQVKRDGYDMLYVAMFDEVDEATVIFKCTNNPPTGNGGRFLTYEGFSPMKICQVIFTYV